MTSNASGPYESERAQSVQWGVQRPDGLVFVQPTEDDARGWVEQGNADGLGRYRLLTRPLPEWQDVTADSEADAECEHSCVCDTCCPPPANDERSSS